MNPVLALYAAHAAKVAAEPVALACGSGCAICCWQLVACSEAEYAEIDCYLDEQDVRAMIQRRGRGLLAEWQRYRAAHLPAMIANPLKPFADWFGRRPCLFLTAQNTCAIYPVRPFNCRSISSTMPCRDLNEPGCQNCRFPYERELAELFARLGPQLTLLDLFCGLRTQAP